MSLTNPTYNMLAQIGHTLAGFSAVTYASRFGTTPMRVVSALVMGVAAIKEFWFDMKYETAEVSGGLDGGLEDFGFYSLGVLLGILGSVL